MEKKTLLIGYGNTDREDDGVAWHILCDLSRHFNSVPPQTIEDEFPALNNNTFFLRYMLQLTPELSEEIAQYDRVCFIDTHVGIIPENIRQVQLNPEYQPSPMTHHLTPQTCLVLAETLYNKKVEAVLISVRGYNFGFSQDLSPQTQEASKEALNRILNWLES
jgi:hydrogenase maturation protease